MRFRISGIAAILLVGLVSAGFLTGRTPVTTYTGLVGTRAKIPANYDTSNNQMMAKSFHYARANITSVQPTFACWYENISSSNAEAAPGSNCVVKGSVEYPPGTCIPATFSGMSSATVTAGLSVKADPVAITIPNGAKYFINEYMTNASGLIYSDQVGDWTNGDRIDVGVSGIADHTVDCAAVTLTVGFMSYPTSITGSVPSNQASVCLLGDSMTDGQDDAFTGTSGDEGLLARSVGPSFGYINMGVNADSSGRFNASHTQRALLLQDCTTAVSAYGHNNFFADGETLVVMEANQQTMYGTVAANLIGSKTIIQTTLPPTTTSSDNWATLGNQTVSGFNASLAGYNSALRAATTGPTGGYFDVNSVVGTSTNTMFWITNGTAFFMTVDGVHPSPAGYALIQSSGIIDTTRMH